MKALFTLILILYSIVITAQERFFNLYPGWETNVAAEKEYGYLLYAMDTLNNSSRYMPCFIFISPNGELVESIRYESDTIYGFSFYSSNSYSSNNDHIIASGIYLEFMKNYILNPILMCFNNTNYYCDSIIDFKSYFNGRSTIVRFHREVDGKIHLFGGSQYSADWNTRTFFAIYDTLTGDFTMKDYTKPSSCVMTPYQALPTPDGGYLVVCEQDMTYSIPKRVESCILKIDINGTEQWRYVIPTIDSLPAFPTTYYTANFRPRLLYAEDGKYWVVWTNPKINAETNLYNNPQSSIRIAKLEDTITGCIFTGERSLMAELDNPALNYYLINDSYQSENGDMYLLLQNYWGTNSSLVKIHANGVGAWIRTYKCYPDDNVASNSITELYGITKTSEGGFILTGKFFSPVGDLFPSGMIASCVFKVDSCGCFDAEGCNAHCADTYAEYYVNMAGASIFPNPASDKISVGFEYEGGDTEFEYRIYSLDGRLFSGGTTREETSGNGSITPGTVGGVEGTSQGNCNLGIDICDLPAGYYTIQFWGGGKIFTGKFVKE